MLTKKISNTATPSLIRAYQVLPKRILRTAADGLLQLYRIEFAGGCAQVAELPRRMKYIKFPRRPVFLFHLDELAHSTGVRKRDVGVR